jgi:hypothetical protein
MSNIIYYQLYKNRGSSYAATKAGWNSKPFRPYFSNSDQSWYYLVQIISSRYTTDAFCHLCRKIVTYMLHYLYLLQLSSTCYIASASYNFHLHTVSSLYPTFIFCLSYPLCVLSFTILCIMVLVQGHSSVPYHWDCDISFRSGYQTCGGGSLFSQNIQEKWRILL